jgi:hypothetical protein
VIRLELSVDDLESERTERYRGFESLRFRPPTSTNTEIMIPFGPARMLVVAFLVACDPQDDPPGYLSHRIVAGAVDGSLGH